MSKLTLNDLANLQNEGTVVTAINANSALIETAIENTLSRDGTTPNSMATDIDMDSHRILNLLDAASQQEPVTLAQFQGFQSGTLGDIQASLDFVFGSTPNLFMVRGASTWGSRAIIGDDLPTPSTTSLGGVLALSPTVGQVVGGLDENGNLLAASQINLVSSSSIALTVGRQASSVQPAFQVNSAAASAITGIVVTALAAGNGVDLSASGEVNVPLRINANGPNGTLSLNSGQAGVSTAPVLSYTNLAINHNTSPTLTIGSTGNTQGIIRSPGTGGFLFGNTEQTGTFLQVRSNSATDTNYIRIGSQSGANSPVIDLITPSTDLGHSFIAKGSAGFLFSSTGSGSGTQFQIVPNSSGGTSDRWIRVQPGNSGGATVHPTIDTGGSGATLNITNKTAINASDTSALVIAKTVGLATPAFRIDTSVASAITGLLITSRATGGGIDLTSIGDATTNIRIDAAGAGTVQINGVGTGLVQIGAAAGASTVVLGHTAPILRFGTSGNVSPTIRGFGSGTFQVQNDTGENLFTVVPNAASGIAARVSISAVTAGGPTVSSAGTAADINFSFAAKGAGAILFATGNGNHVSFQDTAAATTNFITMRGATASTNCLIGTSGGSLGITSNLTSTGSLILNNATAIPAGGTAGTGVNFSSTANFGITVGSGAPTLAAAKGSVYLRSDGSSTSTRMYINTDGSTTWTNVTTAA